MLVWVYVYKCMSVSLSLSVSVSVCVCLCLCLCLCLFCLMSVCVYKCMFVCMHACMHVSGEEDRVCVCVCVCLHASFRGTLRDAFAATRFIFTGMWFQGSLWQSWFWLLSTTSQTNVATFENNCSTRSTLWQCSSKVTHCGESFRGAIGDFVELSRNSAKGT